MLPGLTDTLCTLQIAIIGGRSVHFGHNIGFIPGCLFRLGTSLDIRRLEYHRWTTMDDVS